MFLASTLQEAQLAFYEGSAETAALGTEHMCYPSPLDTTMYHGPHVAFRPAGCVGGVGFMTAGPRYMANVPRNRRPLVLSDAAALRIVRRG
jgi:hypothetical protein